MHFQKRERECRQARVASWTAMAVALVVISVLIGECCVLVHAFEIRTTTMRPWNAQARSSLLTLSASSSPNRRKSNSVAATKRKPKHKNRSKGSKKQGHGASSPSVLSQQELAHHVSSQYIVGPGGILRETLDKSSQRGGSSATEHLEYLKKLDRHPSLVLNADYQPLSVLPLSMWHWQEAVKAVFSGKVTVVDVYDNVVIRAAHLEVPLPSVIALNDYVPQFEKRPAFTKRNVFLRDEYRCQYCRQRFHTRDLSLDHVTPRCMGGQLTWENAVTCCHSCNGRKGRLLVSELPLVGMSLRREPYAPTQFELARIAGKMLPRKVHPTWAPYLPGHNSEPAPTEKSSEAVMFFEDI